ncbi:Nucleolar protein 8 [Phytophthora citrophthora]|uniref:Nucleolar protein 8 n=1 Tax=Phytophthora citrophthora TaxID=4793 RepID=A0AAD9G8B8_9STRA|nr:Nucleolar protein 8 [Phytophthora citrophthora]
MTSSVRVYVGGLPADAKNQELRERFGRFVSNATDCQLTDVVLPKPKPMGTFVPPPGSSRGFAYLTLEGADAATQSEKLQQTFNRTKWRGSVLKVQLAKPHFELKLQQEWEEAEELKNQTREKFREQQEMINTPPEELQPLKTAIKFKGRKKTNFPEVTEEEKLEEVEQVKQETDTETSEEEQESEGDEETESEDVDEEIESDEANEETESEGAVDEGELLGEDDVEAFVRQMEEENANEEKDNAPLTKEEMNARRLAALEAKQQRKKEEKVVIPAVGEAVGNKKITFDDSGNEQEKDEEGEEEKVISNWMDSSDEEGEESRRGGRQTFDFTDGDAEALDAEAQAAFALRPEFVGEKGKKLFEMQKRFGGDSRFRLDARFLEEGADEYGGNDVEDEEEGVDAEAIAELQNFLEEENPEEAARHAREMREEEEAALRVVSKLFPDVDVTRLQRRLQEQRAPKDPLKEAAWMGELKRYDPRDAHACQEFEIPITTSSSGSQKEETIAPKREEKEIPTGGDRFFSTTGDLSNLFTRVRKNSEDGEEGEAALDGVFSLGAATETDSDAPFKLSSLFSFPVGEDKPLAAMGEQLLEDEEEAAPGWAFSQPTEGQDEVMATDSEADEEDENVETELKKKKIKKSLEDFLAFGRTFVGGEEVADWPERRKKLTLDYKRKRRDAVKMKKRQNKQQKNKTERKKARL